MKVRQLSREEARRIAIRAQLLDAARPDDLLAVVDRLTFLQLDPTAVVAPSADLVAWARLGDAYQPAQLQQIEMYKPRQPQGPRQSEGDPRRVTPQVPDETLTRIDEFAPGRDSY